MGIRGYSPYSNTFCDREFLMRKLYTDIREIDGKCIRCPNCIHKEQQGGKVTDDPEYEYACKKGRSIVTDDRLRFLKGIFPPIPEWCPLPDVIVKGL